MLCGLIGGGLQNSEAVNAHNNNIMTVGIVAIFFLLYRQRSRRNVQRHRRVVIIVQQSPIFLDDGALFGYVS